MKLDITKENYEKDLFFDLKTACTNLREAIIDINDLNTRQLLLLHINKIVRMTGARNFHEVYSAVSEISDIAKAGRKEKVTVKFMERLEELWSILDEVMLFVGSSNPSGKK